MPITAVEQGYIDEIREEASHYVECERFFKGHVEELYASEKVRRLLAKSNLTDLDAINFAKIPCIALASRLTITGITAVSANGEDLSTHVSEIWDRNLMGWFTPDTHLKTSYLGDYYLFAWPVLDDNNNVISVDVRVNSPMNTRVFYDPEDPLLKVAAAKVWTYEDVDSKTVSRANFYYPDRIEKWVTDPNSGDGNGTSKEDWVPALDDPEDPLSYMVKNEWGEVPFFHHRTDFPYGEADNKDAWVPQIMINKLVISHASVIDFQNFPQRYLLTDAADDNTFGGADNDADYPEDDDNDPENPLNASRFRADPGSIWITTAHSAGQFSAATPDTFIAPFNRYVLAMSQVTQTPMHEFDPSGQPPSGESLKVADAPLVNRANNRKLLEGAAWSDMWQFVMELLGYEGATITVNWASSATNPGTEDWDLAQKKIEMGVPRDKVLIELGYKAEDVATWNIDKWTWLNPQRGTPLIVDLINAGVLTAGPELEKVLRKDWELPSRNDGAPYGRPDASDLDYGTVLVDERRAALGLKPLPNGEGQVRASAAPAASSGAPGNSPTSLQPKLDSTGQPMYDGEGNPIYENDQGQTVDASGNPVDNYASRMEQLTAGPYLSPEG